MLERHKMGRVLRRLLVRRELEDGRSLREFGEEVAEAGTLERTRGSEGEKRAKGRGEGRKEKERTWRGAESAVGLLTSADEAPTVCMRLLERREASAAADEGKKSHVEREGTGRNGEGRELTLRVLWSLAHLELAVGGSSFSVGCRQHGLVGGVLVSVDGFVLREKIESGRKVSSTRQGAEKEGEGRTNLHKLDKLVEALDV